MKADELLPTITDMAAAERAKLRALLLRMDDGASTGSDRNDVLFDAVRERLARAGVATMPWNAFRRSRGYTGFRDLAPSIEEYARNAFQAEGRAAQTAAYRLIVDLVIARLRELEIPVALTSVLRHLVRAPGVVDSQFPGYRESGMLPFVLKRQMAGTSRGAVCISTD